jgi:hypothetical protein
MAAPKKLRKNAQLYRWDMELYPTQRTSRLVKIESLRDLFHGDSNIRKYTMSLCKLVHGTKGYFIKVRFQLEKKQTEAALRAWLRSHDFSVANVSLNRSQMSSLTAFDYRIPERTTVYCTVSEESYNNMTPVHYYDSSDTDPVKFHPYPWQDEILAMATKEPTDRIIWIADKKGGCGKSLLCKLLVTHFNAHFINSGTPAQMCAATIDHGASSIVVVDLPRAIEKRETLLGLASFIENLNNGLVNSNFYGKSSSLVQNTPFLLVLANWTCPSDYITPGKVNYFSINDKKELYALTPPGVDALTVKLD